MSKILFRLSTLVFLFLGALSILNPSFSKDSVIHNEATNTSDVLSTADLDSFRRQLLSNWNVPVGSKEFQGYVDIKVEMNSDTSVDSVTIVSTSKPMSDPFMRAFADSALRAVANAGPFKLPLDHYEQWKMIIIRFDPQVIS